MLQKLTQTIKLFSLLYLIDKELAEKTRNNGCPYCNGPLHKAGYNRKPRGGPDNIPEKYCHRFGLCCGKKGCRKRTLPPSTLFMGRRVYWGSVVLIVMTLRQNRQESFSRLSQLFGVPKQTIKRWAVYFREQFPFTQLWKQLRGKITCTVGNSCLPSSLVQYFLTACASQMDGIVNCLKFLAGCRAAVIVSR